MIEGIVLEDVSKYLENFAPKRNELFKEMESYALKYDVPIVGPHVGALLHMIVKTTKAKRVLELGTAIGYSGIWIAEALPHNGKLITIEWDKESAAVAKKNIEKAGLSNMIDLRVGSAQEILPEIRGEFDIVFNDIDKEGYVDILPYCVSHLKKGGLFITDNVLWSGRVARSAPEDDLETSTIREFNKRIFEHPELLTVIVPLRDGVSVCLKV